MQGSHDYVSFVSKGLLLPIEDQIKKDRAFDAPEVIAAVQQVHDLAWKHRVMATLPADPDAFAQGKGFWEGRHAMRQEGNWVVPDLAKNIVEDWQVA